MSLLQPHCFHVVDVTAPPITVGPSANEKKKKTANPCVAVCLESER